MLSNRRLVAVCAIAFCCNIAGLVLFVKYNAGKKCFATLNEVDKVTAVLPDDFLSFAIDTSEIESFKKVDFSNPEFRKLAAALSPARFRVGGTMSERLIFSKNDLPVSCHHCPPNASTTLCHMVKKVCKHKFLPFFLLSGDKWDKINEFCKAANLKLLFSLNVLLRDRNVWNDVNAIELLNYTKEKGYEVDWQLGNEPNSFRHVFNITITPHMLANDFKKLRNILNSHGFRNSLVIGPDTTRPQPNRPDCLQYMEEFLGNGSHHVNVRSWHQYYLNGRIAKLDDFWNPVTFGYLEEQIVTMVNHTKNYSHIPMWLTETSTAYGGGAPGLSNSYAGTPLWIDKLGLAAKYNISTVVRQSFFGGNYSMVDQQLQPLPDWWVSLLFKRLVGNKVLQIQCHCTQFQRMYAHCTNRNYTKDPTAVTIFAINLEMAKKTFLLNGTALHGNDLSIDEYVISAPSNNRLTKKVLLNGWPLFYETSLEELKPRRICYGNHISMPPYSMGFWVVRNTSIKVCK